MFGLSRTIKMMIQFVFFVNLFFCLSYNSIAQTFLGMDVHQSKDQLRIFLIDSTNNLLAKPIFEINLNQWLIFHKHETLIKERYGFFKLKRRNIHRIHIEQTKVASWNSKELILKGSLSDGHQYQCQIEFTDQHLSLSIQTNCQDYQATQLQIQREPNCHYFGAGQQHSYVRLNGKRIENLVQEQGIGAGDQPVTLIANTQMAGGSPTHSYAPIPYISDNFSRGILIGNTEYAQFNLKKKKKIDILIESPNIQLKFFQGRDGYDLLEDLTAVTGRPTQLPEWVWGSIIGMQGGQYRVDSLLSQLQNDRISVQAIWIQDWVGRNTTFVGDQLKWNWIADSNRYPDIRSYARSLEENNIALLGYINPMFITTGSLFHEGDSLGYFVKNHDQETYIIEMTGFNVGLLDLTHPEARTWMKQIIQKNLIENGFKGWMADFGEALPFDCILYNGASAECFHNEYPVQWAKLNKEAIQEVQKEKEIAFFSRSSYVGGPANSSFFWIGDQMTSWQKHDGISSVVKALLSSGMSGMSINHADIGGFAGFYRLGGLTKMIRTPKLLKRHIELACLSPVFRSHEGILPDHNAQVYDKLIRPFYQKFIGIRKQWQPYITSIAKEAYHKGYPMVRHLSLEFPNDEKTWYIEDQFMLGDSLLIAPILTKRNKRRVYLPNGKWRHILTGDEYHGSKWYSMKIPVGQPAYFERLTD